MNGILDTETPHKIVRGNLMARQVTDEVERLGGQVVALWSNVDRKEYPDIVVLAYVAGQVQPWATWTNRIEGGLCWGHYFATRSPAWVDFIQRSEGYGAS